MSIAVECPACRTGYEVDDADAGSAVECECGEQFEVPTPSGDVPRVTCPGCRTVYEVEPADLGAAFECECGTRFEAREASDSAAVVAPVSVACPQCRESYEVEPDVLGSSVECECGQVFTACITQPATPVVEAVPDVDTMPHVEPMFEESPLVEPSRTGRVESSSKRRASSSRTWTYGIVAGVAVLGLVGFMLMPPGKGVADPDAETDKGGSPSTKIASTDPPPVDPDPAAPDPVDPSVPVDPMAVDPDPIGSSNPNELTQPDEFVIGGGQGKPMPEPPPTDPPQPMPSDPPTPAPDAPEYVAFVAPGDVPTDVDDAVKAALESYRELEKVEGEVGTEDPKWVAQVARTGGWLRAVHAALQGHDDPRTVVQLRLLLAHVSMQAGHFLEAGVLGTALAEATPEDILVPEPKQGAPQPTKPPPEPMSAGAAIVAQEIGRRKKADAKADPTNPPQSAAMIALASLVIAYEAAPPEDRTAEFRAIVRVAEIVHRRWPQHERADAIRLHAGELHRANAEPRTAIEWYLRIPKSSKQYATARLLAGQAASSIATTGDDDGMQKQSAEYLEAGIAAAGDDAAIADNVAIAKLTLARMAEREEQFDRVVALLAEGPRSVVAAVAAGKGPRPARGVRSQGFARLVYQTLIRAQLKTGRIAEARTSLASIEQVAGDDTALLANLSLGLATEMAGTLSADTPDPELIATIVSTLERVAKHAADLSSKGLLEGAETSSKLAETMEPESETAVTLHRHAATFYTTLLERGLSTPESTRTVESRLARSAAASKQYERAVTLFEQLLTEQPNVLDTQFAAATSLAAWGTSTGDRDRLVAAIGGRPPAVWGFGKLSLTYQQLHTRDDNRADHYARFLECRYEVARARLALAGLLDGEARTTELEKALREVGIVSLQSRTHDGSEWQRLDAVHRELQTALGRTPTPLFTK